MSDPASLNPLADFSAALSILVAKAAACIVSVHSHRSRSSGFVWRPGLIVTADEALSEEGEIAVTLRGGDTIVAPLVGRDPTTDVAILRIDRADLQPLSLGTSAVSAGMLAIAVGAEDGCADRRPWRGVPRRRGLGIHARRRDRRSHRA